MTTISMRRTFGWRRPVAIAATLLPLLALAACGGNAGPSVDNIRAALKTAILAKPNANNNAFYAMFKNYGGDTTPLRDPAQVGALVDRVKLEESDCTAASNAAGYYCQYRVSWNGVVDIKPGVTVPEWSDWYKGRFFQAGGTWNFEEQR